MKLKDKVAIITGSSRGIGKGLAIGFAKEGAKVVVVARTDSAGQSKLPGTIHETAEIIQSVGGEALPIKCDLTNSSDLEACIEEVVRHYGRIDILVNNAAIILHTNVKETSLKRWHLLVDINIRGPIDLCKLVLPQMLDQNSGHIINISSEAAGNPEGLTLYGVGDAALERFTKGLALEVRNNNIFVNSLDPGRVKTEGALYTYPPDTDWSGWKNPEDVVPSAIYLATLGNNNFTGQSVLTDEFGKNWP